MSAPVEVSLTPRERQVVDCIERAMSSKEIAYELNLSLGTVQEYVARIARKTKTRNRVELAMWSLRKRQGQ